MNFREWSFQGFPKSRRTRPGGRDFLLFFLPAWSPAWQLDYDRCPESKPSLRAQGMGEEDGANKAAPGCSDTTERSLGLEAANIHSHVREWPWFGGTWGWFGAYPSPTIRCRHPDVRDATCLYFSLLQGHPFMLISTARSVLFSICSSLCYSYQKFLKRLQMVLRNLLETMNSDYIPRKTRVKRKEFCSWASLQLTVPLSSSHTLEAHLHGGLRTLREWVSQRHALMLALRVYTRLNLPYTLTVTYQQASCLNIIVLEDSTELTLKNRAVQSHTLSESRLQRLLCV